MYKGLFLDRDGVINYDYGYVGNIERFKFKNDIFSLVRRANNLNYKVIIITNQAGIARGFYSESDFLSLNEWMINEFKKKDCNITETFYCPFHPTQGINLYRKKSFDRKPFPGMILKASEKHIINLKNSILVGDKISDIKAGIAANIPNLYYLSSREKIPGAISIENLKEIRLD